MDIKERFYSKLEQLREAKKPSWEKEGSWSKQMKKQEKYAMKKLTPKAKAARDAAAEKKLEEEQLDEKAKWRKNPKAIASKEDAKDPANSEQDDYYGWEAPRSTGRMKAKGDEPYSYSGLNRRPRPEIATQGSRKGKITKKSAERLKDRIKANLKK